MRERDDRHGGSGSDVPRLFVAVPVPANVGLEVGRVIGETRGALGEEGLHLTLRFLGPTRADRVPDVAAALDRAAAGEAPFEVRLAGAGAFPSADPARALSL